MNKKSYLNGDTFMYQMIQKCGYMKTLEVFFKNPTEIHFIRSISREINLAQTSVRNHIKFLLDNNIILEKTSNPFNGYVANRENEDFIFYKSMYNLSCLKQFKDYLIKAYYPKSIVLFGSYLRGEDIESSDIDIFILSKNKRDLDLDKFEKDFNRKINILIADSLERLDTKIKNKILNGFVLDGEL